MATYIVLAILVPVALTLVADAWVYRDARLRQVAGHEPTVQIGMLRVDSPEAWLVGCLVMFALAFPLYLIARHVGIGPSH